VGADKRVWGGSLKLGRFPKIFLFYTFIQKNRIIDIICFTLAMHDWFL